MPVPPKADPGKICESCGDPFFRRRFNGRLEDRTRFLSRKTCSQSCGNKREAVTRSGHAWRVRGLKKANCEKCGTATDLTLNHKDGDWANDAPGNIETLCRPCHLKMHWREHWTEGRAVKLCDRPEVA